VLDELQVVVRSARLRPPRQRLDERLQDIGVLLDALPAYAFVKDDHGSYVLANRNSAISSLLQE